MSNCLVCGAAHFIAQQAAEATGTIAKGVFRAVAMFLTSLCLLCPLDTRAEESASCPVELNKNPVVMIARFIKGAGPPPFKILCLLSGGRINIVTPPKVMLNNLMDVTIAIASNRP